MQAAATPALTAYITAHYEVAGQAASVFYATTVSTRELSPQELAVQVAGKYAEPIQRVWRHDLYYPEVSQDPREALRQVWARYGGCAGCHLSERRTKVVLFRGNPDATVAMFGEGPGRTEDAYGEPFVGASRKLQDKLLEQSGIPPQALAWMNMVGCRPCNNRFADDRPPSIVEKIACSERTLMLLRAIRPRVVVCLGQEATTMFFDRPPPPWTWTTTPQGIVVGHGRHPAYLARRLGVQGGEAERVAAIRFYRELASRMPSLTKVDRWPLPVHFLGEIQDGRIGTH